MRVTLVGVRPPVFGLFEVRDAAAVLPTMCQPRDRSLGAQRGGLVALLGSDSVHVNRPLHDCATFLLEKVRRRACEDALRAADARLAARCRAAMATDGAKRPSTQLGAR